MICWLVLCLMPTAVFGVEASGHIGFESRAFMEGSEISGAPDRFNFSVSAEVEAVHDFDGGGSLVFTPFWRWDPEDTERNHGDIRILKWEQSFGPVSVRLGMDKVFWGVAESYHLVDIINQIDILERRDHEEKFGQPMVNLAYAFGDQTVEIFWMPYFRERLFPGAKGRFQAPLPVDTDLATFESSREEAHPDVALRWFATVGDLDIGVAHFHGTQREPELRPVPGRDVLAPHYPRIRQVSLDAQWIRESWLFKLEYLHRYDNEKPFHAAIAGVEHTMYGLFDTAADLGVMVEYLFDDRGNAATSTFDNDLFCGLRLVFNDTGDFECVAGPVVDLDTRASLFRFEVEGRIFEDWRLCVNTYLYSNHRPHESFSSMDADDFLEVLLKWHF